MANLACTRHAIGVAYGNRAAIDVQNFIGNPQLVAAVQHLAGECLVEFPESDVIHLQSGPLEQARDGKHRSNTHLIGFATGHRIASEGAERFNIVFCRFAGFHQHTGRSTI